VGCCRLHVPQEQALRLLDSHLRILDVGRATLVPSPPSFLSNAPPLSLFLLISCARTDPFYILLCNDSFITFFIANWSGRGWNSTTWHRNCLCALIFIPLHTSRRPHWTRLITLLDRSTHLRSLHPRSAREEHDWFAFLPSHLPTPTNKMDKYQPDADSFTPKRRSKWVTVGLPLLGLAIVAAVVGGVVGSRAAANNAVNVSAAAAASGGSPSSSSSSAAVGGTSAGTAGGTSAKATGGSSTASAGTAVVTPAVVPGTFAVVDLPVWDWGKDKAVGMCLASLPPYVVLGRGGH
jgi:hypothetical protein